MDVPDTNERGFSGPWAHVPDSFSARNFLLGYLAALGTKAAIPEGVISDLDPCPKTHAGILSPQPNGPFDTRIVLYFTPGCDLHQIPGGEGQGARIDLTKQLMVKFLDAADIGCRLNREMLECGVDAEVSTVDVTFTISGMLLDEVLAARLGHLLLRMLMGGSLIHIEDDHGIEYPVRFCGCGFMHL